MISKNAQGVNSISEDFENDLQIYVKLFTILHADDTVLLAESAEELQSRVILFLRILWEMELKCKHKQIQSHVFSNFINLNLKMNNMELEIVSEFIHLGTNVSKNRIFQEK